MQEFIHFAIQFQESLLKQRDKSLKNTVYKKRTITFSIFPQARGFYVER